MPPQSTSTQTPTPKATHRVSHSRPLFPSVARLLHEHNVQDPEKIKGTGIRGMLTKGDVLAFLGKASSPTGTFKPAQLKPESGAPKAAKAKAEKAGSIRLFAIISDSMHHDHSHWMDWRFVSSLYKICIRRQPRRALRRVSTPTNSTMSPILTSRSTPDIGRLRLGHCGLRPSIYRFCRQNDTTYPAFKRDIG